MKILFIGNSYTYYNDLSGMLQKLGTAAGKSIETSSVTGNAKSLEWHLYNNPKSLDMIDIGGWDYVVLQEFSTHPVADPDKMRHALKILTERAEKQGAKSILYMTWARQNIPEMQEKISAFYRQMGTETGAEVAPVGEAWRRSLETKPDLVLHISDRSHPNILGTYLAVCVFYSVLFKESPVGLSNIFPLYDGVSTLIDQDKAEMLQKIAWECVEKEKAIM